MTISKKLSIIIALALGVQLSSFGLFTHEKEYIFEFAQDLRANDSAQAQQVALWIDQQILTESTYSERILGLIQSNNLTEESKITLLSELMAQQKRENRNHAVQSFVSNVCGGILFAGFTCLFCLAAIEEAKNPKPRYYYYDYNRPGITWTYTWPAPSVPMVEVTRKTTYLFS
jgi:hypothetical protein